MRGGLLPEAKPLILCDDVLADPATGNVHLIHAFDAIRPRTEPAYPHPHPSFCVFLQLTDAEGEVPCSIEVVEARSRLVVFRSRDFGLRFPHRRFLVRASYRLRNCTFPRPGVYWIEFYCNGQFITDQTLHLVDVERSQ